MKVAVIGSGGREHAICNSLKIQITSIKFTVYRKCRNKFIAENIKIELDDFNKIKNFIIENEIN